MSSIVVFKTLDPNSAKRFELSITEHTSIESAKEWLEEAGAENDQEVIDLINLDDSDPAIAAIANVLFLAVDANASPGSLKCPAEALLERIFLAGFKASEEMMHGSSTLFHVWVRQVPKQT